MKTLPKALTKARRSADLREDTKALKLTEPRKSRDLLRSRPKSMKFYFLSAAAGIAGLVVAYKIFSSMKRSSAMRPPKYYDEIMNEIKNKESRSVQ